MPSCLVARGLAGSMRSALRYSMTASRYFSPEAYLSPRSRWRSRRDSGDREQPVMMSNPMTKKTVHPRVVREIKPSSASVWQIITQDGVQRLNITDQTFGGFLHASVHRA